MIPFVYLFFIYIEISCVTTTLLCCTNVLFSFPSGFSAAAFRFSYFASTSAFTSASSAILSAFTSASTEPAPVPAPPPPDS